jgi:hypothetical protein
MLCPCIDGTQECDFVLMKNEVRREGEFVSKSPHLEELHTGGGLRRVYVKHMTLSFIIPILFIFSLVNLL